MGLGRSLDAAPRSLVSFAVSFVYIQQRPAYITRDMRPRSRTFPTCAEPSSTDLESVLAATAKPPENEGQQSGSPPTTD
jgi:hypothetical protein